MDEHTVKLYQIRNTLESIPVAGLEHQLAMAGCIQSLDQLIQAAIDQQEPKGGETE